MKKIFVVTLVGAIFAWFLPFLFASGAGGDEWVFNGLLLNPIDGNSYLAKMQIGWRGDWKFTLPYTADPGEGAYLFLLYITLGHLSRILSLPIPWMFHLTRLLACILLVWTLWKFMVWFLGKSAPQASRYFPIVVFGSGLGWFFSFIVGPTSDFWVAEAFPFLSGLANPHFPLGMCLILWIFIHSTWKQTWKIRLFLVLEGVLLSIIMQFGLVVVGVTLFTSIVWDAIKEKRIYFERLIWSLGAGGVFLCYQYYSIQFDPVLAQWNLQNLTPSPFLWDFIISFLPWFGFAIVGYIKMIKSQPSLPQRMVICWFVVGAVLVYIPFSLQRRFLTGYYFPVIMLGILGFSELKGLWRNRIVKLIFLLSSTLTNVIVIITLWFGITTLNPNLFISKAEKEALNWLEAHAQIESIVAASPQMGMFIPARTSLRVIYGHPLETVNAEAERNFLEMALSSGGEPFQNLEKLKERGADYMFFGERERAIGSPGFLVDLIQIYENDKVKIYQIPP